MQIFKNPEKKAELDTLIAINNHVYGISFFDNESKYRRLQEEEVIRQNIKFQRCVVDDHILSSRTFFKIMECQKFILFGITIPPRNDPYYGMDGIKLLEEEVIKYRREKDLYICKIALNRGRRITEESMAQDQQIVDLYFKGGYPAVAVDRLIEFMNRAMGVDLPGENFPNYNFDELQKIAAHINRENFNFRNPRADAIPKYEIVNGRPAIL